MKCIVLLFFFVGLFSCAEQSPQADLIIHGGKIYTVEDNNPIVEAVAVKEGKIIFT